MRIKHGNYYTKTPVKYAVMLHASCCQFSMAQQLQNSQYQSRQWTIRIYHEGLLWLKKSLTDLHLSEHLSEGFGSRLHQLSVKSPADW